MTRSPFQDNSAVGAPELNALLNAHNLELIQSGCTPTKGTGDWDVDIASGTAIVGPSNGEVSVSSQTVDLNDPTTATSSGESIVNLVTINNSGTASATEGTGASDPTSPDIPSDEVLVAVVVTDNADATIADSRLIDPRVIFGFTSYPLDQNDIRSLGDYLVDDWNDNNLTGRSNATGTIWVPDTDLVTTAGESHLTGYDRPEWTTQAGSPDATNQQLELDNSETVDTTCEITVARFKFDYTNKSSPTTGEYGTSVIREDSNNLYEYRNAPGSNTEELNKIDGGANTSLITTGSGGETDTNTHTIEVTRDDSNNFELIKDGTSQGTATDSYLPTATVTTLENQTLDATVAIDNLKYS